MARVPHIQDPEAFCRDFISAFLRPGRGRMPKRDIDVLELHLLDAHSDVSKVDRETARSLGSTPARIRRLRADARDAELDSTSWPRGFSSLKDGSNFLDPPTPPTAVNMQWAPS